MPRFGFSLAAVLCVACGPAKRLEGFGSGVLEYQVDDPRCLPARNTFEPTLRLVVDGGVPDGGLLAFQSAEVRLEGLPPCRLVDMVFGQAIGGIAYAVFRSSPEGVVSTAADAPVRGSWSGVDVDGPLYSSEGALAVQDVQVLADWGADALLELTWPRRSNSTGIDILPIRGARGVFGDLYLPAATPPWPVLIAIGGAEGGSGMSAQVARTYVEQGYLVLALAYWKTGALPPAIQRIPLEYFLDAMELMKEYPGARADRIGFIGLSRGSEAALLTAAVSTEVKAVVAVVPSGVSWPAADGWTEPSWTVRDAGVPFVPWTFQAPSRRDFPDGGVAFSQREAFTDAVRRAPPAQLEAAIIPVERINGPVLLLGASEDQVWPSCALSQIAWNRLVDAGHPARFPADENQCFIGAGHAVNPGLVGLPLAQTLAVERDDAGVFDTYGGTVQGNGIATREAFRQTTAFLERALKR